MGIDCLCAGILFADHACTPISKIPDAGELVPTDRTQLGLGGCASNAALDLAKLGVKVGVSGCVGDDVFGNLIIGELDHCNVDTSGIHRLPDIHTASTLIINVEGQDRRFISTPGANARFTVEHIPNDWVRQAKVLYVGGFLMMEELENEKTVDLFRTARAGDTKTVLDVVLLGGREQIKALKPILPETDVFLPNDHEAAVLTSLTDPIEQAEFFRDLGAKMVVITKGSEGAILLSDNVRIRSGVYPTEYVGGTGSGDAFDAGFIAGMLSDQDPASCLRWGSALGASCVRAIGATESVFTRLEAEAFIKEHDFKIQAI